VAQKGAHSVYTRIVTYHNRKKRRRKAQAATSAGPKIVTSISRKRARFLAYARGNAPEHDGARPGDNSRPRLTRHRA
jgi:hypothetical protein